MRTDFRNEFLTPPDEFTPIPFWFWNDELSEAEISRQMDDFKDKGVMGFVIHPRKGMPKSIPYLSDTFMHYVKYAVDEAQKRNMHVVLYDEAMYPSGSAHGLVVKENSEYATRALRMEEGTVIPRLETGEKLLAVVTGKRDNNGLVLVDTLKESSIDKCKAGLQEPAFFLIESYSHGTIRGMHIGEDDLEEDAPPSADLLNPKAMETFLRITYERYYEVLEPYFGNTIIGMFTDEPCVLGRCGAPNCQAWTDGFDEYWKQAGGRIYHLPLLWKEASDGEHVMVREHYNSVVNQRLSESYYGQISRWCETHNIALTGHPGKSDDMGLLRFFHIPGQDVVWRWIAPNEETRIVGADSTLGKCSSDAARHHGRRRNSNECFGCCGPKEYNWGFTADDMKWYMDWLFVRGVNLLYPHAFFYSVNGEERFGERPPDVGPNNLFWNHYSQFANYIKRMSWLMTDSYNTTCIAILGEADHLPWEPAKQLFEHQIEFNYLEDTLLVNGQCRMEDGGIRIEKQFYDVLLVDSRKVGRKPEVKNKLKEFSEAGGKIICWDCENNLEPLLDDYREIRLCSPIYTGDIRVSHVVKHDVDFYLLVNEGETMFTGTVEIPYAALRGEYNEYQIECWDAWKGVQDKAIAMTGTDALYTTISLERRETLILCVEKKPVHDISNQFLLGDWTKREGMAEFSGTVTYETTVSCTLPNENVILDLGEVCEAATVKVNGRVIGTKMWAPYRYNIGETLKRGENIITIDVFNTPANKFDKARLRSGLLGPVKLIGIS